MKFELYFVNSSVVKILSVDDGNGVIGEVQFSVIVRDDGVVEESVVCVGVEVFCLIF